MHIFPPQPGESGLTIDRAPAIEHQRPHRLGAGSISSALAKVINRLDGAIL
jgi:hypothetical protein